MSHTSIFITAGEHTSDCGYCSQEDSSHSYGLFAHTLTCKDYQHMINRGWRRSGTYVYKPNLRETCCRQYTIRLIAKDFQYTKKNRKIINRLNRYVNGEYVPEKLKTQTNQPSEAKRNDGTTSEKSPKEDLIEAIHSIDHHSASTAHKFEVKLEPASYTEEKYQLYRKYQITVHHDEPEKISKSTFKRFLIESPMELEKTENSAFLGFGSFHQSYFLDGKLIAVGVIDILPTSVSSVYFFYDPEYGYLALGKYSALREIALTLELNQLIPSIQYYMMGYYIHTCSKMKYKGEYKPSELLDPITYEWAPFDKCTSLLNKNKYTLFVPNANGTYEDISSTEAMPGMLDPESIADRDLEKMIVCIGGKFVSASILVKVFPKAKEDIKQHAAAIGIELANRSVLYYQG
ncbi:Arginyl-tRNA--protein transferase 1 [Basidiobolus ranarum]|uniref:Arginyl-tRNA--protein transferase 1 n=1 Tax=Basidiobolus ranarum TaxID=34480 RepID=A0ABR2X128_9FUNG